MASAISTRKSEPEAKPADDDGFDDEDTEHEPPVHIVAAPAAKLQPSQKAAAQRQASLDLGTEEYRFPPLDLLGEPDPADANPIDQEALAQNARLLETVLQDFGVKGEIVQVRRGRLLPFMNWNRLRGSNHRASLVLPMILRAP